jgi:putative cardiolipin synthase
MRSLFLAAFLFPFLLLFSQKEVPSTKNVSDLLGLPDKDLNEGTWIHTLESGGESLAARLWLIDKAQKSIDIQYYSFSKDVSGLIACEHIIRAADKGVKVRLLVDDAASTMMTHEIRALDSHENIEIRIYNSGLKIGRIDKRLGKLSKNYRRLLRRMHDKTLNIDRVVSILGGRNIQDRYYDLDETYNFRDRDALLIGEAALQATKSFEAFWGHELTVPYTELAGKKNDRKYLDKGRFDKLHHFAADTAYFSNQMRNRVQMYADTFKARMKQGRVFWNENIHFVSDKPGKNEDRDRKGGTTTDSIKQLISRSQHYVVIDSPYFITTDDMKEFLKTTVDRGVKIKVLTNSMASTDNHEAFSAYQKDREGNLGTGVRIFEFKPDPAVRYKLMIPEVQAQIHYKATYGMHSKTMLLDGHTSVVGSYNLDPRSANYNTECIVIVRSPGFSEMLSKFMEEEFLTDNAWEVSTDFNPDKEAKLRKKIKTESRKVLPKKLL